LHPFSTSKGTVISTSLHFPSLPSPTGFAEVVFSTRDEARYVCFSLPLRFCLRTKKSKLSLSFTLAVISLFHRNAMCMSGSTVCSHQMFVTFLLTLPQLSKNISQEGHLELTASPLPLAHILLSPPLPNTSFIRTKQHNHPR